MAASRANIELVQCQEYQHHRPCCPHGPTLLFERVDRASKKLRQFYACSAFRDRKACSFFQWADQKIVKSDSSVTSDAASHRSLRDRYFKFRKLARSNRHICCTCGLLLVEEGESQLHESKGHSLKHRVGLRQLRCPSTVFRPLDDNKTFAQYLFSQTTVQFVVDTVASLGYTHLLCVGAPRIHEEIQLRRKTQDTNMTSLLLDLDDRYAQVYPPSLYIKYNMFNNHIFEEKAKRRLLKFLAGGSSHVVLVTDPPFGGMVDALCDSFSQISKMWASVCGGTDSSTDGTEAVQQQLVSLVWFFPYFMENRIISQLPQLAMLDYKVDYDNHLLFNNQHKKKKGSPVRMFTNIPQAHFVLPAEEGYWFCQLCQRFSSKENWHCSECGACTSKDGTCYVHCDVCQKCVKPSRIHCFTCQACLLKDHTCGQILSLGCHICGERDHKRRECPQRGHESVTGNQSRLKRKPERKRGEPGSILRKKLKKK